MQNLALTSQFSNSGRRGNSSSNSFNSIVLNGVLPPNEDGRVEGIEGVKFPPKKKGKKIIDASSKPWGYEFWYDPHDPRNFTKERLKELNKVDNENYGKFSEPDYPWGRDNWPPPKSIGQILTEEAERKRNQPETEEEKERRLYRYMIFDRLRNLFNPIPNDYVVDIIGQRVLDWVPNHNEVFKNEKDNEYLREVVKLMVEDLLSGIMMRTWYFDQMLQFILNKEQNIDKEYSFETYPEFFNPPLQTYFKPDENNVREIRSVRLKVVVKFVNGKAVVFIYAIINHSGSERTFLVYEQPMEF